MDEGIFMLNKFLNDKGVKFLLKNKKYLLLFKLILKFLQLKLKTIDNPYKYILNNDISIQNIEIITNLKLRDNKINNYNIQLTGFNSEVDKNIFYLNFEDKESLFSVYRFRWLLIGIEKYQNKDFAYKAIDVLNYYIDNFENIGKRVNETYSICERLLNIIYFISILKENNLIDKVNIDKLNIIFSFQLEDILSNIEYRGKFTNNHILNNTRALYILGAVLKIKELKDIGYLLLSENYDNHIKNGVLEEGSFHYQILLTRTMLEIYHISKICNDEKMLNFITMRVQQMLNITNNLHSNYSSKYPLVGDVSPDFPVEFFEGYPFSNVEYNSKWNNIFDIDIKNLKEFKNIDTFWKKFEFDKIEVWIIKRDKLMAHSHNDNGSFIIFYEGKEIISDIGRFTYRRNNKFSYMLEQKFHNGINEDIDISRESIFYNIFNFSSEIDIKKLENSLEVNIKDCFEKEYNYKLIFHNNFISIVSHIEISINTNNFKYLSDNSVKIGNVEVKLDNLTIDKIVVSYNYGELKKAFYLKGDK